MSRFWDDLKKRWRLDKALGENSKLRRQREVERLQALPDIPFDPTRPTGVLLADEIERYATQYKMIDPFDAGKLTGARYELSVGDIYSIGGKTHTLTDEPGKNEIVIKPFEVVIVQTLERLNMPRFVIARWNVRIKWAYEGLLWVGAPQVDAGYRGFLDCPLYNLSDKPVRLHRGEEIAVMDFVTTTPPTARSEELAYKPLKRTRILFEDYQPERLQSALATQAKEKIEVLEKRIDELQRTVNTSVGVILTAIGILVAALALFVSKQLPDWVYAFSPSMAVATIALIMSLVSFISLPPRSRFWLAFKAVASLTLLGLLMWAYFYVLLPSSPTPRPPKNTVDTQIGRRNPSPR